MHIQLTEKEKIDIRLESLRDAKCFLDVWRTQDINAQCKFVEDLSSRLRCEMKSEINHLNSLINDKSK